MHTSPANTNQMNEITHHSEITHGTPNVQSQHTKLSTEVLHDAIIARRAIGENISHIARELGCSRQTVYTHLRNAPAHNAINLHKVQALIPKAIDAIDKSLQGGDGKLALSLLERLLVFSSHPTDNTRDTSLTVAINTLIQSNSPAPVPTPHPSGHEGEGDDLSLDSPRQNSPNLAVRDSRISNGAPVVDAEIISTVKEGE